MVTPRVSKGMSTSLPEPLQVSLYGKAAVKLRVLRWNLPWIIQIGTKCNYKHPFMREAETDTQGRTQEDRGRDQSDVAREVPRQELEVERALGTLDATHKVPRNPGLPREEP